MIITYRFDYPRLTFYFNWCSIRIPNLLVIVFLAALLADIPFDLVSLYFTLVQTLIAVMTSVNLEEEHDMTNSLLVASGTHGVVQDCWEKETITSAE